MSSEEGRQAGRAACAPPPDPEVVTRGVADRAHRPTGHGVPWRAEDFARTLNRVIKSNRVPLEPWTRLEAPDQEVRKGTDFLAEEIRYLPARARFSYRRLYPVADVEVCGVMVLPGRAGGCS